MAYLGGGGFDPSQYMMQKLMDQFFDEDSEAKNLASLRSYDIAFNRKWEDIDKEDVSELEGLDSSIDNIYKSIVKNKSKDEIIPFEDAYNTHKKRIEKRKLLVTGYNTFAGDKDNLGTLGNIYVELEKALVHNQITLDQIGENVFGKKYDNWENLLINGSEEDKVLFNEKVRPHMEKNGENISDILMRITDAEKEFTSKYTGFRGAPYVSRDVQLLRQLASNLGDELSTSTFLTDNEAKALQKMWVTKDSKPYLTLKAKQTQSSDIKLGELKARKKQLAKEEEKFQARLDIMKAKGEKDAFAPDLNLSMNEIGQYVLNIQKSQEEIDLEILKTGELGAPAGIGKNLDLIPIHKEVKKAKLSGLLGLPVEKEEDVVETKTPVSKTSTRNELMRQFNLNTSQEASLYEEWSRQGSPGNYQNFLKKELGKTKKETFKRLLLSLDSELKKAGKGESNFTVGVSEKTKKIIRDNFSSRFLHRLQKLYTLKKAFGENSARYKQLYRALNNEFIKKTR